MISLKIWVLNRKFIWHFHTVYNFDNFEKWSNCIYYRNVLENVQSWSSFYFLKNGRVGNTGNFHCSVICIRTGSIVFRRGDFPVHENESMRYCCTIISSLILFKSRHFLQQKCEDSMEWRRHFPIKSYLVILPFVSGSLCQLKLIWQ